MTPDIVRRSMALRFLAATERGAGVLEEAFERRVAIASDRARSSGVPVLASVSIPLGDGDPSAIVLASRREREPWFCFEQPDRDGFAIAGLGCLRSLGPGGAHRFASAGRAWRELAAAAVCDSPGRVPGSGLIAFGGFAFAADGCSSIRWRPFASTSMLVPELSIARHAEQTWLTVNADVAPDDMPQDVLNRVRARVEEMRSSPLPVGEPLPSAPRVVSASPPSHYEEAVARAVARIAAGEIEKIVLARVVEIEAGAPYDPAPVVGLLREAFGSSFVYAVGRDDSTFVGASPELLVRREGQRATTVALAGSTRRSADPAVDDHLGERLLRSDKDCEENAIVARQVMAALRRHSVWVVASEQPSVVRVANIQHLARPIRAQLTTPIEAIELAGVLHPTPAVGAEPPSARASIPALEGIDRGWYAGPVGWTDASGDGEFCVALRCGLLRDRFASCYAGCGIMADSDPAAELAESELKLQVMLAALIG
jgi:isochorismate synthase